VNSPLVSLRGVGVRFGPTPVLTGIDLDLAHGQAIGVTGPNGAGKSTLLGVIATLLAPTEGSVALFGSAVQRRDLPRVRRNIGMSAHEPGLYGELTLLENLELVERVAGDVAMSAMAALEVVGLAGAAHRRSSAASAGMQRRTDLARLIMTRPQLVLLDEAHAGLDSAAREIVDRLIHRTCEAGGGAVVVSHDRSVLARSLERIIEVRAGAVT
jgi:heme ABC exporter ATP-binding subunit CcmA